MYKLIIGNVRITVHEDSISRDCAVTAAQEAVRTAGRVGKHLSQIDIYLTEEGISVKTTEKVNTRSNRKTLKQSMYDSIMSAAKETLASSSSGSDRWVDDDSGQQWHGSEVEAVRNQVLSELGGWLKQNQYAAKPTASEWQDNFTG